MSFAAEPKAPKPDPSTAPQESTGAVASDSLAAESINSGEGFSQNDKAAISSVKGSNSTLNNTDTSGATVLASAPDGATREKEDAKGLGSDEKGTTGVKYPDASGNPSFEGTHSQEGYVGGASTTSAAPKTTTGQVGSSGATGDSFADGGSGLTGSSSTGKDPNISSGSAATKQGQTAGSDTYSTASGARNQGTGTSSSQSDDPLATGRAGDDFGVSSRPESDTAPNYAAAVSGDIGPDGQYKPKGENLKEGDIPATKTFTGNVGGDKDPGRLAEQQFAKITANTAGGVAGGQEGKTDGGQFDVLSSERA